MPPVGSQPRRRALFTETWSHHVVLSLTFWLNYSASLGNLIPWNSESWFFSYAIPNLELLPKACLAASPTPHSPETRLKEIFSISGGKLEDVLSCLSGLMSVSV